MGVGNSGSRFGMLALFAAAALCVVVVVGQASGALVGKDGRVYACYKAKGKRKGAVRLVTKKGKCHKGEKKASWSAAGPSGGSVQVRPAGFRPDGQSGTIVTVTRCALIGKVMAD